MTSKTCKAWEKMLSIKEREEKQSKNKDEKNNSNKKKQTGQKYYKSCIKIKNFYLEAMNRKKHRFERKCDEGKERIHFGRILQMVKNHRRT